MEHPSQEFWIHPYMYQARWQEPYPTDCTSGEHCAHVPPTAPTKHTHRQKDPKCKGQGQSLPSPRCPSYCLKTCLLPRPLRPGLIDCLQDPRPHGSFWAPVWVRSLELDLCNRLQSAPPPTSDPPPFSGEATSLHLMDTVTMWPGKYIQGPQRSPQGPDNSSYPRPVGCSLWKALPSPWSLGSPHLWIHKLPWFNQSILLVEGIKSPCFNMTPSQDKQSPFKQVFHSSRCFSARSLTYWASVSSWIKCTEQLMDL